MFEATWIRDYFSEFQSAMERRGLTVDVEAWQALDARRKEALVEQQALQAERNRLSKAVGECKRLGESAEDLLSELEGIKSQLNAMDEKAKLAQDDMEAWLASWPNVLHESVPEGRSESENIELHRWGTPRTVDALDHVALGEKLGTMDFETAAVLSGSRFVILRGSMAKLHRALAQWMLDVHVQEHGYEECTVPYIVQPQMLFGTGQLPKFEEDHYFTEDHAFSLIPTAEVPLLNQLRAMKGLKASDLPRRWVAHSPCFRKEAGSYGRDTRGMIRMHQFDKVEMVQVVEPSQGYEALEAMRGHAERLLQDLELPYRVVTLCAGDTGFSSAKTYDLEVWLPGQQAYREICSISQCEGFQSRRMKTKLTLEGGEKTWPHTLNGTGLAVGRALVAVLENGQEPDGRIRLPKALHAYMGGKTHLGD